MALLASWWVGSGRRAVTLQAGDATSLTQHLDAAPDGRPDARPDQRCQSVSRLLPETGQGSRCRLNWSGRSCKIDSFAKLQPRTARVPIAVTDTKPTKTTGSRPNSCPRDSVEAKIGIKGRGQGEGETAETAQVALSMLGSWAVRHRHGDSDPLCP